MYTALHRLVARGEARRLPRPDPEASRRILATFGRELGPFDTDGIVPARSQVYGEVLRALSADHHDVVGHFHEPRSHPPHIDWIASGARFERSTFEALWNEIADRIARLAVQAADRPSSIPSRL